MFTTMLNTMIMLSIVMLLGYYLQKKGILNDEVRSKLTYILLNVSLPLTFFMSFQVTKSEELLGQAMDIILLSIFAHALFIFFGFLLSKVVRASSSEAGIIIFGTAFKNLTFMGFPVIASLFAGLEPTFYGTLYCIPFNILTFSLGPVFLPKERGKISVKDFLTPINFSIIIGLVFFIFNLKFPQPVENAIVSVASMTIPMSLLLTGALLTKSNFKTIFKEVKVIIVAFATLVVFPLVFYFIASLFNFSEFSLEFSFIMTLLPSATMTLILTDKYNGNVDFAGKVVLFTTVLSLFTVVVVGGLFI